MHRLDPVCRLVSLTAYAVHRELVHASSQLLPSRCCSRLAAFKRQCNLDVHGSKQHLKLAASTPVLPMQVLKSSCRLCEGPSRSVSS